MSQLTDPVDESWERLRHRTYTLTEAAPYLAVSRAQLWYWVRQGVVPAYKLGLRWMIAGETLERLIREPKDSSSL